jgi:membrane protease YdiL (CAAX protease family)
MKSQPVSEQDIKPHSVWKSILLHLLPGALLLVFFILAVPIVENLGCPRRFATLLGIFLVLIPFQLGVLFYEGKRRNGKYSLEGVVVYRERIPRWQYFLWVPLLLIWSILVFLILSPVQDFLIKTVFPWLPEWFIVLDSGYSKNILIVMVTAYGIANVSAAIVEELYFRGYLMPRLSRLKGWAPLVNTVLFALQHFLTPWQQPSIILGILPQAFLVSKKRNIYLGILAHSLLNLLSSILLIMSVFG